jgi:hypothetical protein
MPPKKIDRIISSKRLTAEEAAEYRRLWELADSDKQEIIAEGRKLLAEKRSREAADCSSTSRCGLLGETDEQSGT